MALILDNLDTRLFGCELDRGQLLCGEDLGAFSQDVESATGF